MAPSAAPVSRIHWRSGALSGAVHCIKRRPQAFHGLGIFDNDDAGLGEAQGVRLFRVGEAGVERRGDGSGGHDAEVGEVELGARFRLQRDHVAGLNTDSTKAHRGPLHAVANFGPSVGAVLAAAYRLLQGGLVRVEGRSLFEHGVNGPRGHDVILTCAGLNLAGCVSFKSPDTTECRKKRGKTGHETDSDQHDDGAMLLGTVSSVLAQDNTINERQRNQQKRIGEGVENGSLTAGEAARLEKQEAAIHHEVKTERKANGGTLTAQERRQVNAPAESREQADLQAEARRATSVASCPSSRVGGVVRRASFFYGVRLFTSSRRPLTGTWSYVLECPSAGTQQSPAGFRRRSS